MVVDLGGGPLRVNGEPVARGSCARPRASGSDAWTMTFYREEYADHGRPYGGRIGGELGHQRPQPGRHRVDQRTGRVRGAT